jgi:hypothetical protein
LNIAENSPNEDQYEMFNMSIRGWMMWNCILASFDFKLNKAIIIIGRL